MREPGLSREARVFLNRVMKQYQQDELPNAEQIRHDVNRLAGMAISLDDQIEKLCKREA